MRNTGRSPRLGQDPKSGRFVKGNRLGPGRPWGIPRAVLSLTYRSALEHACTPQDLLEITKRAVADAKKGDHFARMFVAKVMGLDSLKLTIDPAAPGLPMPVYHIDGLSDDEFRQLDALGAKMIEGPAE